MSGFGMRPVKPQRVQLRRTRGWRLPPNTVVVARPSEWGNPFSQATRAENATVHRLWLLGDTLSAKTMRHRVAVELRGKNLACWCPLDEPCHADVLLEVANGETAEILRRAQDDKPHPPSREATADKGGEGQ